jgi:hypothetical protein
MRKQEETLRTLRNDFTCVNNKAGCYAKPLINPNAFHILWEGSRLKILYIIEWIYLLFKTSGGKFIRRLTAVKFNICGF